MPRGCCRPIDARALRADGARRGGDRGRRRGAADLDPDGPASARVRGAGRELFAKRHGVMVNSGSSANYLAVELLDLPPDAEVVTPALTFATTVAPLVRAGLVPVVRRRGSRTPSTSTSSGSKPRSRPGRAALMVRR